MTAEINLRVYEELNDYLPLDRRKRRIACKLKDIKTVGELLKELKIPRNRIDLILINGKSAGFSQRLKAEDWVSVYPVFETFDITPLLRGRRAPLRRLCFMIGPCLTRLARRLRLLGIDVVDSRSWTMEHIIRISEKEKRILLTRDAAAAGSPGLTRVYLVRSGNTEDQMKEVLSRFDLFRSLCRAAQRAGLSSAPK